MGDHWRKALSRKYEFEYVSLAYSGVRNLHDDEIRFAQRVTAIVGGNGVGKSTLAHAIVDVVLGRKVRNAIRINGLRVECRVEEFRFSESR